MSSKVMPVAMSSIFECHQCGARQAKIHVNNTIEYPKTCSCQRKGRWRKVSSNLVDTITGVLEELPDNAGRDQLHTLRFVVRGDLCKNLLPPGTQVEMVGILYETAMFKNYVEQQTKDFTFEVLSYKDVGDEDINAPLTKKDEDVFAQIRNTKRSTRIKNISKILFPNIYGRDHFRELMIMQAFGGTTMIDDERDWINGAVCGSPGVAKSKIAQMAARINAKGAFQSGTDVTAAGLTIAAVKDPVTGVFMPRLGLMPLCDKGIMVLDEIDKIKPGVLDTLHTPMESGFCACNKAGIMAKASSKTAILCTSNEKVLGIMDSLDSRFDFRLDIEDEFDPKIDKMIADKVIKSNTVNTYSKEVNTSSKTNNTNSNNINTYSKTDNTLPIESIRKYIWIAKNKYPYPQLSVRLTHKLSKFYVKMRQFSKENRDLKLVSPRTLQGLFRYARAIARSYESNIITKTMLLQAIDYLKLTYADAVNIEIIDMTKDDGDSKGEGDDVK